MAQINFKQIIEEVKNRTDIIEIVSGYVSLKKRGKNHVGLCPFHSEKTPSFTVSSEKNIFHCFGCGEGGNVFDFIMKAEKLEFIEALKLLGEKAGVQVEVKQLDQRIKSERELLFNINEAAGRFFELNLEEKALDYLVKRGVDRATSKQFRIGFARDSWDDLLKHLVGRGFDPADVLKTGLIIKKEGANEYFDRFRGRIIFPIIDTRSRVVGFSGRTLLQIEPKYLNSPDSPVFHKGEVLFGLNLAQDIIKKKKFALLVEGNFDLVLCHQHGFTNTIAPLGTAFTFNQAKLLKRLADLVVIAYDSDAAGRAAAERSQAALSEAGVEVRIADLKDQKDPADFLKEKGAPDFLSMIKESEPALTYKIKEKIKNYDLDKIESKIKAIEETAGIISNQPNHLVQKEYAKLAAKLLNSDENTIMAELKRKRYYKNRTGRGGDRGILKKLPSKREEAEKCLIRLAIEDAAALTLIKSELAGQDFGNSQHAEIIEKLLRLDKFEIDDLDSAAQKKLVRQLLLEADPINDHLQTTKDCIRTIKQENLKIRLESVRSEMKKQETEANFEQLKEFQREFQRLGEIYRSL